MVAERAVRIGFLNVVATPHPNGVYERLLRQAGDTGVNFYGESIAAITSPRAARNENHLIEGRIVVWTEIDESQPGINKRSLSAVRLTDMNFRVPADLGFNGKVFAYVFNTRSHVLAFETRNEFGQNLSPVRAQRIFDILFSARVQGTDVELVEVTVIPEDDALSQVLALDRLDRVDIYLKRPNDDDITKETNRIMAELMAQNVKSEERILSRAPKTEGIELSAENQTRAEVAASNGYVTASGQDADGVPQKRSTKKYPKIEEADLESSVSAISLVRDAARRVRPRAR